MRARAVIRDRWPIRPPVSIREPFADKLPIRTAPASPPRAGPYTRAQLSPPAGPASFSRALRSSFLWFTCDALVSSRRLTVRVFCACSPWQNFARRRMPRLVTDRARFNPLATSKTRERPEDTKKPETTTPPFILFRPRDIRREGCRAGRPPPAWRGGGWRLRT